LGFNFESRGPQAAWRVLQQLKSDPEWRIDLDNIGVGESLSRAAQFNTYSQKMMNSRICLAPPRFHG